jgi:hypothetical protein
MSSRAWATRDGNKRGGGNTTWKLTLNSKGLASGALKPRPSRSVTVKPLVGRRDAGARHTKTGGVC